MFQSPVIHTSSPMTYDSSAFLHTGIGSSTPYVTTSRPPLTSPMPYGGAPSGLSPSHGAAWGMQSSEYTAQSRLAFPMTPSPTSRVQDSRYQRPSPTSAMSNPYTPYGMGPEAMNSPWTAYSNNTPLTSQQGMTRSSLGR